MELAVVGHVVLRFMSPDTVEASREALVKHVKCGSRLQFEIGCRAREEHHHGQQGYDAYDGSRECDPEKVSRIGENVLKAS